jgi:hypothetical protein
MGVASVGMAILTDHRRRFRRYPGLDGLPDFCMQFAAAFGGWIAGFGVLKGCSAVLVMANDLARESLVSRYYPLWSSLGWLLSAWLAYRLTRAVGDGVAFLLDRPTIARPTEPNSDEPTNRRAQPASTSARAVEPPKPSAAPRAKTPDDWRMRIKTAQRAKDVWAMLAVREELHAAWPEPRRRRLDRKLGRWFTKYFQRRLQRGQADRVLAELTRVAEIFANDDEFKFFGEALPTVRESVEIKAAILAEQAAEDAAKAKEPPIGDK